jgi:hypothetical protein
MYRKYILLLIVLNLIFLPLAYSAPREAGNTDAMPIVLYGKDSNGALQALKTGTTGGLQLNGTLTRTTAPAAAGDGVLKADYEYAMVANDIPAALQGYFKNTGSASGGSGHGIGNLGYSEDTTTGAQILIGNEGKVLAHSSSAINYFGLYGDPTWQDSASGNTTTFSGGLAGGYFPRYVYNFDGVTARAQGTVYGVLIPDAVGSTTNYGLLIQPQTGGGTTDISAAIGGADTITLWVNYDTDSTTAAKGIVFGASADTKLYRSAASTLTTDGKVTSTATSDIGWAVVAGANTACNTTCTSACVFGFDAGTTTIVACTDATADKCICAGAS